MSRNFLFDLKNGGIVHSSRFFAILGKDFHREHPPTVSISLVPASNSVKVAHRTNQRVQSDPGRNLRFRPPLVHRTLPSPRDTTNLATRVGAQVSDYGTLRDRGAVETGRLAASLKRFDAKRRRSVAGGGSRTGISAPHDRTHGDGRWDWGTAALSLASNER
jgi:hypothetical protein